QLRREARVEAVCPPLQGRPGQQIRSQRKPDLALLCRQLRRPLRGHADVLASGQSHDLRLASALEIIEADEAFADILADRERAVVAKDHRVLGTKVSDQPLTLIEVDSNTFILVKCDLSA